MPRFDVGIGSEWHIHEDHIKFNNSINSRVNFDKKDAAKIIEKVNENVSRYNLPTVGNYFTDCIEWITKNY